MIFYQIDRNYSVRVTFLASFLLIITGMRIPRRFILGPHSFFHKIWRAHNREFLLQSHHEKRGYLFFLKEDYLKKCSKGDFLLHGYCIMSNHVHETGKTGAFLTPFSNHMRRAHGRFGLCFNKRHRRLGKVAHDRPKTSCIQDSESLMRCMFYSDCNPVRAGLIRHPTDIQWKGLSSCRFYTHGESNEFTDMLTQPEWYMELGNSNNQRQQRYRSLLDKYLVETGLKRDPKIGTGYFLGGELWMMDMTKKLREILHKPGKDPPNKTGSESLDR